MFDEPDKISVLSPSHSNLAFDILLASHRTKLAGRRRRIPSQETTNLAVIRGL